jgi:3-hydroxyisobutyrate dehydrogenase
METVGLIGIGKIGLPIAQNLIKSGYRVLGYRRSAMSDFEKAGGVPARSPAEVGAQAEIVLTCLPSADALDEVIAGKDGLVQSARPGQIVIELGSHLIPEKQRQIAPLAAKGAIFLDGEVGGTPGMVTARKAVVYLAGDEAAAKRAEPVMRGISDIYHYFGPFGAASKVKLINNLLVTIHIAAAAEAMALGVRAGVDTDKMIKAVAAGSGGSAQFAIRAPWMAERRFLPAHGNVPGLSHYFELVGAMADDAGVATPLFDRAIELYELCTKMGLGELDHAVMIDVIGKMPRKGRRKTKPKRAAKKAGRKTIKKTAQKSKRRRRA